MIMRVSLLLLIITLCGCMPFAAERFPISATATFVDQSSKTVEGIPISIEFKNIQVRDYFKQVTNASGQCVFPSDKPYGFGFLSFELDHTTSLYDIERDLIRTSGPTPRYFYCSDYETSITMKKGGYTSPNQQEMVPGPANLRIKVREALDPVPMYACERRVKIPVQPGPWGFDLIGSDWVAPHGTGKRADILIGLKTLKPWDGQISTWKKVPLEITMSFPNPGDGIMMVDDDATYRSRFVAPYSASASGYRQNLTLIEDDRVFPLRRRTIVMRLRTAATAAAQVDGKRLSPAQIPPESASRAIIAPGGCIYGRIAGGFGSIWDLWSNTFNMTYYINPDSDSVSLEYDRTRNLYEPRDSNAQFSIVRLPP